jgi:hypothetical protein
MSEEFKTPTEKELAQPLAGAGVEYEEDVQEDSYPDLNDVMLYLSTFSDRVDDLARVVKRVEGTQAALKDGVNTIGVMMNNVAEAFGQIMTEVQKGGIAGLLGSMMGGKKNDDKEA